jgi:hypothetical protein
MQTNLLMVLAFGCGFVGALFTLTSQYALWRRGRRVVVAYPRVLARLHARRLDRRFGLFLLGFAAAAYALASRGYSAPLSLWQYPATALAAVSAVYLVARLVALYRRPARSTGARTLYETPRTRTLRDAAISESAALRAMEIARDPRDRGIVFLAREWDRRWWSNRLGASSDAIRAAIRQVGPMVTDIEQHLNRQQRQPVTA